MDCYPPLMRRSGTKQCLLFLCQERSTNAFEKERFSFRHSFIFTRFREAVCLNCQSSKRRKNNILLTTVPEYLGHPAQNTKPFHQMCEVFLYFTVLWCLVLVNSHPWDEKLQACLSHANGRRGKAPLSSPVCDQMLGNVGKYLHIKKSVHQNL